MDATGLSAAAVQQRVAAGLVNDVPRSPTPSAWQIVRSNTLTPFNALLGGLLVVILLVGPLQDALFGGVLVANALVGIVQELRAKRTLDRLAVLQAPSARVVRQGAPSEVPLDQVVLDDVLDLAPGDQMVVDGEVLSASGLELDESLLSGESNPVAKQPGDEVLSGSFVAAGGGRYRATRVGAAAYAARLAAEARRYTLIDSELRAGVNRIIVAVAWALVPTAALLFFSQLRAHPNVEDALRGSVAGVVAMVPEGLVLLTSVAFAVAVVRLGRRGVLVQELPAVEALARVDVLCIDKTGTLTEGRLVVEAVEPAGDELAEAELAEALRAIAAADPHPNVTLQAVAARLGPPTDGWRPVAAVPFSSARKWSAASFAGRGTWVLGAPELLLPAGAHPRLRQQVEAHARDGRRVLLLQRSPAGLSGEALPEQRRPAALVLLADRVRGDAAAALAYFDAQGVAVKVISGDHPATVAAVAARAGVPGAGDPLDARDLPADAAALADAVEGHALFGRVSPQQKRSMVEALQARGHVVAMTGDGVNDVLALKAADLGIAMGSGSAATRAVAKLVLLDGRFASLPAVVAEGRRVLANIEQTANLFVTKTIYAMLLAIAVGVARFPFPFLPRHLTLIGGLTIGVPGFFLALGRNQRRARPGIVGRVLRFAAPAGTMAAAATLATYVAVRGELGAGLAEARTTAVIVLGWIGLVILLEMARPLTFARRVLVAAMGAAFAGVFAVPAVRRFFALQPPPAIVWLAAVGVGAIFASVLRVLAPEPHEPREPPGGGGGGSRGS